MFGGVRERKGEGLIIEGWEVVKFDVDLEVGGVLEGGGEGGGCGIGMGWG